MSTKKLKSKDPLPNSSQAKVCSPPKRGGRGVYDPNPWDIATSIGVLLEDGFPWWMIKPPSKPGIAIYFSTKATNKNTYGYQGKRYHLNLAEGLRYNLSQPSQAEILFMGIGHVSK